jgi:hypothetical protein
MTYPTLMVHLTAGSSNAGLLQTARDLADRFHVIGIAACQPMQTIAGHAADTRRSRLSSGSNDGRSDND